jgi:uncharacterized protein (TIGR02996 family)
VLRDVARVITDEHERLLCTELPREFCADRSIYFTTCFVEPRQLPGCYLAQTNLPVVVKPSETPAVMVLPAAFWPTELVAQWDPLPVRPAPRRPPVLQPSPSDRCPHGVAEDLPPLPRPRLWQALTRGVGQSASVAAARRAWERRIAFNPDNEDILLAYADWLDACGDEQGRFIRLHLEIAALADDDPRQRELNDRWYAIFHRHSRRWLRGLLEIGVDAQEPSCGWPQLWFDRGLLTKVHLDQPGILPEKADRLFTIVPALQQLGLGHMASMPPGESQIAHQTDLARLFWLPHMRQVHELDLNAMSLAQHNTGVLGDIPYLSGLRTLNLGQTEYGLEGALHLARSRYLRLRSLTFASWDVGEEGIRALAAGPLFAELTSFQLFGGYIGPSGAEALFTSPNLGPLNLLGLYANAIGDGGAMALARCPALAGLTQLHLGKNLLTTKGVASLASSPTLAQLTQLDLGINHLDSDSLAELARSLHMSRLRVLLLCGNAIGDEGVQALAGSTTVCGLTALKLGTNRIGDAGARALANSPNCRRLTCLELGSNQIGASGVEALAQSPHLACLKELDLKDNPIGLAGARTLARARFPAGLTRLNVSETAVGGQGVELLRDRFADTLLVEEPPAPEGTKTLAELFGWK